VNNSDRGPIKVGAIGHKGIDIANLEPVKRESAILSPIEGRIAELRLRLNATVKEG
jgi:pyruvate carboxylase